MGGIEFQKVLSSSFLCVKQSLNDKIISVNELKTVLQCLGLSPSDEDVEKTFKGTTVSFDEYCEIANTFSEFSEEDITILFSKCIPVQCGKIKMTDFVRAFGPLSKDPENGKSYSSTDTNFSKDDNINLTSVISNITRVASELRKLSCKRYDKYVESLSLNSIDRSVVTIESVSTDSNSSKIITLKGSFFRENEVIISHQYSFSVSSTCDYTLVIRQSKLCNKFTGDSLAFLFREENGERSYVSYTNGFTKDLCPSCTCTLTKGKYIIMPYSTGCLLANEKSITKEIQLIECKPKVTLTNIFENILREIFYQVDLDGNNFLSRQEFNLYNWRTSGDIVEDEEWQAVLENFDVVNGELSQTGFIALHQLEADDCNGKTDDLWLALEAMGYNKLGIQSHAAPFDISLSCAIQQPNLIVSGLRSGGLLLENSFIKSLIDATTPSNIADNKDILVYEHHNCNNGTIVIKNMTNKNYIIKSDCSNSINCFSHRQNLSFLLQVGKHETVIAHHLFPKDNAKPFKIISKETIHS